MQMERRYLHTEFELRAAESNVIILAGYAYKFQARSQNLGGFREAINEGAGNESVASDDIRALFNHEPNMILGRSVRGQGTLRLAEDSTGLHYEVNADARQSYVRDLQIAMERGDITQSSFGFQVPPEGDDWSMDADGFPLRSVRKMTLFDVSPVTYPAYVDSTSGVSQRSLDKAAALVASVSPAGLFIPAASAMPIDPIAARHSLRG